MHLPRPVTAFTTVVARTRILGSFERSPTAVRRLDPDFIPHEISLMIPGDTFFCSLLTLKLLNKFPIVSIMNPSRNLGTILPRSHTQV